MSKGKNNKYEPQAWEHDQKYKSNHHTRLYDSLLRSPAWLNLSDSAKWQYFFLRSQYKGGLRQCDGNGNAMVICPYKDIRAAGIKSNETISKNFAQLEALGFITIKGGGFHVASQYKFSDNWQGISDEEAHKINAVLRQKRSAAKNQPRFHSSG